MADDIEQDALASTSSARIEHYELRGPDGYIVEIEHDIDSGTFTHHKTTRTELTEGAGS